MKSIDWLSTETSPLTLMVIIQIRRTRERQATYIYRIRARRKCINISPSVISVTSFNYHKTRWRVVVDPPRLLFDSSVGRIVKNTRAEKTLSRFHEKFWKFGIRWNFETGRKCRNLPKARKNEGERAHLSPRCDCPLSGAKDTPTEKGIRFQRVASHPLNNAPPFLPLHAGRLSSRTEEKNDDPISGCAYRPRDYTASRISHMTGQIWRPRRPMALDGINKARRPSNLLPRPDTPLPI